MQRWPMSGLPSHLDLKPSYSPADSGPQRFCTSLFRGESCCEALSGAFLPLAVRNLFRRKHFIEETVAESVDTLLDPFNFGQIRSDSKHHICPSIPSSTAPVFQSMPAYVGRGHVTRVRQLDHEVHA
jgi:hypothetical protein